MKTILSFLRRFAVLSAVLFSAGLSVSANAQEAAEISVFVRASGMHTASNQGLSDNVDIDLSADITANVFELRDLPVETPHALFVLRTPGDPDEGSSGSMNPDDPNLVNFGSRAIRAGDIVQFSDLHNVGAETFDIIARVYTDVAGNLALATLAADSPKNSLGAGEFFLDSANAETTTPATTNIGYACGEGMMSDSADVSMCVPIPQEEEGGGGGGNTGGVIAERDDGNETAAFIGGGMVAVGLATYFLWGGNPAAFSFSPDYGYSLTESGYAYNVGGRLDFHQGDFHSYYAVGQANANGEFGDFRYESGGEYTADFWTAAFSETVQGETADYRFSLSADYNGGIWKVSPTYRLHSKFADEEFDTQNSLNLRGELLWNRWTISPSAGFNWRRPEEFGDNARFNLSAVRRF
ncbi:MAG: hypothetical protein ACR2QC_08840 [Gammaproteobacteria bacterium]